MTSTHTLALTRLSQIRDFLMEARRRRLSTGEIEALSETFVELTQRLSPDPLILQCMETLEIGLEQEFGNQWPGSQDVRENTIIETLFLSGYLRSL